MGIFGDFETPSGKKPEPPAKQLVELSFKTFIRQHFDERGQIISQRAEIQGLLDEPSGTVHVRTEAKTAFSDGTAGDGVKVTFFLNGHRLRDVETDEFGLAVFEDLIPAELFERDPSRDEMVVRVKGFAKEASAVVLITPKALELKTTHSWDRVIQRNPPTPTTMNEGLMIFYWRYEGLRLKVDMTAHPANRWSMNTAPAKAESCPKGFEWVSMGTFHMKNGSNIISFPNYYYDRQEHEATFDRGRRIKEPNLCNLSNSYYIDGSSARPGIKISLDGWHGQGDSNHPNCDVIHKTSNEIRMYFYQNK